VDNRPLRGADTLQDQFIRDTNELIKLAQQIDALRNRFRDLSTEILLTEDRLRRMVEIRESVQQELFYLLDAQWDVYELRETALRRQRQLSQRLAELRSTP
jgi:chromosome segregation ATPase